MIVIRGIGKLKKQYKNPVIAIGVFDGLHHGHQRVIHHTIKMARRLGGTSMVMTFFPHPVHVLRPEKHLPLIVSLAYRLKLIEQMGVDVCIVIPFNKRFSRLAPEKFIKRYILDKIKPKGVIIGDDFRFGENRRGTLDYFREFGRRYGFHVDTLHVKRGGKKTVSSTLIRKFIAEGKIHEAAHLLDRPVSILGRVVRGDARGKTLGYPTANIDPCNAVLLPAGVFLVNIRFNRRAYHGIANIGHRPSFKKDGKINIEVYIFDFKKNLYGKEIIIEFVQRLRDEQQFKSKTALVNQIRRDEQKARKWFACH